MCCICNRFVLFINLTSTLWLTSAFFFSCVASNVHGKGRGLIILTGTAGVADFDSPSISNEKESYNISWCVISHAAITEYRLFFRQQPRHRRPHHQDLNSTAVMGYRNEWNSVVLPGVGVTSVHGTVPPPYEGVTCQRMSYNIRGLAPATTYEARVQARNAHGWNKLSSVFHFTTRSNGELKTYLLITKTAFIKHIFVCHY